LERNRIVAQRVARVLSATTELSEVHIGESPAELKANLGPQTVLVALDASELDVALEWVRGPYPHLQVVAWSQNSLTSALQVARHEPRLRCILGWPAHQSIPRVWELALAARRAFDGPEARALRITDLLSWGGSSIKWLVRNSAERDHAVSEVERYAAMAGANSRLLERLAVVAHELLMNAMYDAPVGPNGKALYAHDRKQQVILDDAEAPTLRFALDGMTCALEVVDPFGRLQRQHVLGSILRGIEGGQNAQAQVLDTSHGGAGLGFFRMHAACSSLVVDVRPNVASRVMTLFDMDASPREARALPASLHLFCPESS